MEQPIVASPRLRTRGRMVGKLDTIFAGTDHVRVARIPTEAPGAARADQRDDDYTPGWIRKSYGVREDWFCRILPPASTHATSG